MRSYSSSVEAALVAIATYWLLKASRSPRSRGQQRAHHAWIVTGALCVVMRPPSAALWAAVAVQQMCSMNVHQALDLAWRGLFIVGAVLGAATAIDRWLYGR